MLPGTRTAILGAPTVQRHYGISYNAALSPQLGGLAYAYAPDGALTAGRLTDVFATFASSNTSFYMGPAGLLVQTTANIPRIEYDIGGNLLGLMLEMDRTNKLLWSRDQTNVAWVKTTMTAALDQVGVDGASNSASSLLATAGNALSLQTITQAAVASTFSFWVKRLTGSGTVAICQDGVTFTTITLTTAWQRFTLTATQLNPVLGFKITTNADKIAVDFGQFEAGAFATSVIPTTTVAILRGRDNCARTFGAEYSQTAGTIVCTGYASPGQDAASGDSVWMVDDGTANERIRLQRSFAGDLARFQVTDGGVTQALLDSGSFVNSTKFKSACTWALNDFASSFNGAAVLTDVSGTLPTPTTIFLGMGFSLEQMNGHILSFDYYPERKSNAFLQIAST